MFSIKNFKHALFNATADQFEALALRLFHYQYEHNPVYKAYVQLTPLQPQQVKQAADIPFLPISFFKTQKITDGSWEPEAVFESSGTTQSVNSRHYIRDTALYRQSFLTTFRLMYGNIRDYVVIGLLPSYLERNNSSLVYMVQEWIQQSGRKESGFYLYDYEKLYHHLLRLEAQQQPVILIGVTFALMDFASQYTMQLKHTMVMETGGMKGRKQELLREEVHTLLKQQLGVPQVHSEYGMTELLSQAYAKKDGLFHCPPWMKVWIRDENNPFCTHAAGTGAINIIDLANIHSCAFIATEDTGKVNSDGSFEITGRLDGSALRGCSLMVG